jgi:hypothetical protein
MYVKEVRLYGGSLCSLVHSRRRNTSVDSHVRS